MPSASVLGITTSDVSPLRAFCNSVSSSSSVPCVGDDLKVATFELALDVPEEITLLSTTIGTVPDEAIVSSVL